LIINMSYEQLFSTHEYMTFQFERVCKSILEEEYLKTYVILLCIFFFFSIVNGGGYCGTQFIL